MPTDPPPIWPIDEDEIDIAAAVEEARAARARAVSALILAAFRTIRSLAPVSHTYARH